MTKKPPKYLRAETRKWWLSVTEDYDLELHHLRLLSMAAETWDEYCAAREAIKKHGMTYADRFGQPKSRPEIAIERDCRIGFARLIRELGLDLGEPDEVRPPRIVGVA